jgi:UDP-2,3-diacylglucosamine pyrophosphatase LpxH
MKTMTDWVGKFVDPAVAETEAHQRAQTDEEKEAHTLPKTVTYEVSRDLCQEIRASRRKTAKSSSGKSADSSSEQDSTSQEDASRFVAPSVGVCTLARPVAASVTYMDVGCWGGSAPKDRNTKDHWKKQRFFGIVYERLAVLCAYKPWLYRGTAPKLDEAKTVPSDFNFRQNKQYQKIRPLLEALSTDPGLGPVVVLQAVLNGQSGVESPPDDQIHVILGDLHAPVMTERDQTYVGRPPPPPHSGGRTGQSRNVDTSTGLPPGQPAQPSPGGGIGQSRSTDISTGSSGVSLVRIQTVGSEIKDYSTTVDTGLHGNKPLTTPTKGTSRDDRQTSVDPGVGGVLYPLKGRYDRGLAAQALVPILSRILGKGTAVITRPGNVFLKIVEVGTTAVITRVSLPVLLSSTVVGMGDIVSTTGLDRWSDDDGVAAPVVEDWFDRYHGKDKIEAGADVFDDAGKDLLAWLNMLKTYQGSLTHAKPEDDSNSAKDIRLPVKLIQVGDLFDFWIGLKCPFSLVGGARDFPNPSAAKQFVQYWLGQSLKNVAIETLLKFKAAPTVFLYGNHDTYMGCPELVGDCPELIKHPFPAQFVKRGLIVEHGHKDDPFNQESTAALGYLLTQAVFVDNHVRMLEDGMSAAKTMAIGGLWTRLGYNESALNACVRDRLAQGKAIASTFVMGHTHEPILQRIDIVEECIDPSRRTTTRTRPDEAPQESVLKPAGTDVSLSTHTSTSTGLPEGPKAGGTAGAGSDRRTGVRIRAAVPSETPIPPALQWYKPGN